MKYNKTKNTKNVHYNFAEPKVFKCLLLCDQNPGDMIYDKEMSKSSHLTSWNQTSFNFFFS